MAEATPLRSSRNEPMPVPVVWPAVPRVVVVGVGAITPQGANADALWEGVRSGRVAIRRVRRFATAAFQTELGGEVPYLPTPQHDYRRPDGERERMIDLGLLAAEEAIANANVDRWQLPPERWGVVVGGCAGGRGAETWLRRRLQGTSVDPGLILLSPPQALADALSGAFGFKGPCMSLNTACASGTNAIGYGADLIRCGHADAVLVGGSDELTEMNYAGFGALEALSPKPCTPYSRDRLGLTLGEGAAMLVLAREELALRYEIGVLAEVRGYGLSADGYHPVAPNPEGEGAARAIRAALGAAAVSPADVAYVNGHGTGTDRNDSAETRAIRNALKVDASRVLVSSTKSMIGHLLGAAGAVEAIVTIKALQEQLAPPTANYEAPDPECDLDYVPNRARRFEGDIAISNSFAFGGANACVVFSREVMADALPMPPAERTVVTGMALLSSAGVGVEAAWDLVKNRRRSPRFSETTRCARISADLTSTVGREGRRLDRLSLLSLAVAKDAIADAGLVINSRNGPRVGVVFGTAIGPAEVSEEFCRQVWTDGPDAANPALFPNIVHNAAGGHVSIHTGAVGVATTVCTGHAAGAAAVCYAHDLLSSDKADAVICIAADVLTDSVCDAYRDLGMFSSDAPEACLAESAVGLVLEREGSARARGARLYGAVSGYGIASDALGIGRSDARGSGLERAIRTAVERAGRQSLDVETVWAGCFGQRVLDRAEARAIRRSLPRASQVFMPRLFLGEPLGAGGPLGVALAMHQWQNGGAAHPGLAIVNSSSLGGVHVSIALEPPTLA